MKNRICSILMHWKVKLIEKKGQELQGLDRE